MTETRSPPPCLAPFEDPKTALSHFGLRTVRGVNVAGPSEIAFITFPRNTGSRDGRVKLLSTPTQALEQGSSRVSATTRIILHIFGV